MERAAGVQSFAPRGFEFVAKGLAVGFFALWIWIAIDGAGPDPSVGERVVPALLAPLAAAPWWRASRMRLEASDQGIRVVGFFSDRFMRWEDIDSVVLNYSGMHVVGADSAQMTALMLGQARWRNWTRRPGRNDVIAERLRTLLHEHAPRGDEPAA